MQESLKRICKLRNDYLMNFGRALCDFIICLNENDIPEKMFGVRISQGVEGFLGMASAVIYIMGIIRMKYKSEE